MKYFIILAVVLILSSCDLSSEGGQQKIKNINEKCFQYPKIVDSLNLTDLYDNARWFIYTWHCDMAYLPKADSLRTRTFGELELKFNHVSYRNDTVDIDFYFIDNGETILTGSTRDTRELATGVSFDLASRRKLAMFSHSNYWFQASGEKNRYVNPLQPQVISYIEKKWTTINSCFRELAKRMLNNNLSNPVIDTENKTTYVDRSHFSFVVLCKSRRQ
jgi:hypothetical protein